MADEHVTAENRFRKLPNHNQVPERAAREKVYPVNQQTLDQTAEPATTMPRFLLKSAPMNPTAGSL
jgi:hypothetical protein